MSGERVWVARVPFAVIIAGGLIALFGTYWDDVWHTDFGRDDFFIPPHLVLYAGITVMGAAASFWGFLLYLQTRSIRAVLTRSSLAMMLLGVAATLAAAPIDEFWHVAFGRDAVVWSPPHMVGIMALFALGTGVFLETLDLPGRWGGVLTIGAGALLLGVVHVPVMEYESDVPQFAVLWYLPLLAALTMLAFSIVETRVRFRWIATWVAMTYVALRVAVLGFLQLLDHSPVLIPPIVVPALVFDLTRHRRMPRLFRAVVYAGAVFAVYVPVLNLVSDGIFLSAADALVGLAIGVLAAGGVAALFRAPVRVPQAAWGIAIVALLLPLPAHAHDPGQGEEVTTADFNVRFREDVALVSIRLHDRAGACEELEAGAIVARRAGKALTAPLERFAGCAFAGQVTLPERGRWFVYAELQSRHGPVEAWAPVIRGESLQRSSSVYVPPSRVATYSVVQIGAGALLYLVCTLFVVAAVGAARRSAADHPEPPTDL